jgi:hypothetical protein
MPTGAIPTPKNNNPDKKSANNVDNSNPDFNPDSNNADDNNPYFNADNNNPDNLCKLRLFSKTKLGTKFYVGNFTFQLR